MASRPTYYKCPCGAMHRAGEAHALGFTRMELNMLHGPEGWDEIRHSEVAAWRAGVAQQRETADHE